MRKGATVAEPLFNSAQAEKSADMNEGVGGGGVEDGPSTPEVKVFRIRYFILIMFILLSASNSFQWIEYAIVESVVSRYYNVSTFWINCTSVAYMVSYIIGILPATWFLSKHGLRTCLLISAAGNALGSWIKTVSINRGRFWVTLLGQMIVASSQLFILNIPPLLAATWFPSTEVSRATSYGVFGNQVGIAIGFLIPPHLVPELKQQNHTIVFDEHTVQQTESGLKALFFGVAGVTTTVLLLIVFFFRNHPPLPPSHAAAFAQQVNSKSSHSSSLKSLFTNRNFLLLLLSYGLNTGVFYALSTVLSQMIVQSMGEAYVVDAGYMGLAITLAGIVGSVVCGYILDWSKKFKLVTVVLYLCSLLGTAGFAVALEYHTVYGLYVASIALGFFMTGYLPIGFEFAAEVSFPEPEGTSAGLLNASAQVKRILFEKQPNLLSFSIDLRNDLYL